MFPDFGLPATNNKRLEVSLPIRKYCHVGFELSGDDVQRGQSLEKLQEMLEASPALPNLGCGPKKIGLGVTVRYKTGLVMISWTFLCELLWTLLPAFLRIS